MSAMAALVLCAGSASGDVLYVDDDAPRGGDGQSWATAYPFLQDALAEAAAAGGDVTQIRVGQGLYRPDVDAANPAGTGDQLATFQLVDGVWLAGGYAGIGAPRPNERDLSNYVTTLSGDLLGDDGPGFADNGDNSWHVVTGSQTDATAIIDGFTITAGNASGPVGAPTYHDQGGGLIVVNGSPTVRRCRFEFNAATRGAGMNVNDGGSPRIHGSTFLGNVASEDGGALRGKQDQPQGTNVTVINSSFIANRAEDSGLGGGAISNLKAEINVIGCLFLDNFTDGEGGVAATFEGESTFSNSTLVRNTARDSGGGLCSAFGGTTEVSNSILFENTGLSDPQIYNISKGVTHVTSSNTEGGLVGINGVFDDGGNIDADPDFVDPDGADTDPDNDYHLRAGSPSIGMGDLTLVPYGVLVDRDGNPRLIDCEVDMGAYENQSTSFAPGDTNCDGVVGLSDLADLRANWGPCGLCPADIDHDGVVGWSDLTILLRNWS